MSIRLDFVCPLPIRRDNNSCPFAGRIDSSAGVENTNTAGKAAVAHSLNKKTHAGTNPRLGPGGVTYTHFRC